jgi:glutamate-1-semialdehyde 2,1-aminomutase
MRQYASSRELVAATCHTLLERGYLKATEGNVSARVPGHDAFAITPSGLDYAAMSATDVCVLDYDRHVLAGSLKASIESGMHAAVYRQRPDVHVIIHTHQAYASALALIRQRIPPLFDEQVRFLGRSVEIIDYAPSGTSFLKRRVKAKVGSGANAFILANHGVLVLGGDQESAVHNMAVLEKCALSYLMALMTQQPVHKVPAAVREIAFAQLRSDEKRFAAQLAGGGWAGDDAGADARRGRDAAR